MKNEVQKLGLLKKFLEEFFDFEELKKTGFYNTTIKKTDYEAQSDRICKFFGYKTVYEFGAKTLSAHISYAEARPEDEPFLTVFKSIYE